MREIGIDEVGKLNDCIRELSEYHNRISINFAGTFPSRPYGQTLHMFTESLKNQTSRIAVIEQDSEIIGFCKVDIKGSNGKLDYLIVKEQFRGKRYGKKLMDWAMQVFRECDVRHIEVKVIDGNPAIHLYEEYGFKINAHILIQDE